MGGGVSTPAADSPVKAQVQHQLSTHVESASEKTKKEAMEKLAELMDSQDFSKKQTAEEKVGVMFLIL